jgi:vacuolar-type H+-ATPase subunit H
MTSPNGLPYTGALEAVKRIENALAERDGAREVADAELTAARAEAERLIAAAHVAGTRAAQERRAALLARADADAGAIRSAGEADARQIGERVSAERDTLAAGFTALILGEET